MLPKKLQLKIDQRKASNSLRKLDAPNSLIDFSSNDYIGFSKNKSIFNSTSELLKPHNLEVNGATGSRLLSGNHAIYTETESIIANFHNTEEALVFNSGYDANIGFFSSVPQRGDIILYDELCHASIRDGIKMSNAKAFKFKHNDFQSLGNLINNKMNNSLPLVDPPAGKAGMSAGQRDFYVQDESQIIPSSHPEPVEGQNNNQIIYVVTESVFSMDGDQPDLKEIVALCKKYGFHLIVDEAHAVGVFGKRGEGLVQKLGLEKEVFARIITFGKALGCHGAAILGSADLKRYLVNFARSFIYTTGLPPHSVATIQAAYSELTINSRSRINLKSNIAILQDLIFEYDLGAHFIHSDSAIHCCLISGNVQVKKVSEAIKKLGFDVKPILSPTVPLGEERLRICLHSFNNKTEMKQLISNLKTQLNKV